MSEIEKKWYVLRTVTGKENKVKIYLESEISRLNISHLVSRILIPTEKVYQIRKGKKISKERNFFPGYVLIEADLSGETAHILRQTPDVLEIGRASCRERV